MPCCSYPRATVDFPDPAGPHMKTTRPTRVHPRRKVTHSSRFTPVLAAIRICPLAATKKTSWPSQNVIGFASRRTGHAAPNADSGWLERHWPS